MHLYALHMTTDERLHAVGLFQLKFSHEIIALKFLLCNEF